MRKNLMLAVLLLLSLTACGRPGGPSAPGDDACPEANVVQGRVVDEQGDPVPNATTTISGYTASGANVVETVVTDAGGSYRKVVPCGLDDVDGEIVLPFDGQTFHLYLHPTGGGCHEEGVSADGLVRDFVFRKSGFR